MKKASTSGKNQYCRFFLKFGSGLFILFFTLFAAATPLIAQLGSAAFLFLVVCLSPLTSEQQLSEREQQDPPEAVYCQIDETNAAREIVFSRSQRLQLMPQINAADSANLLEKKLLLQTESLHTAFTNQPIKPEKWRKRCQPVRAGPVFKYI